MGETHHGYEVLFDARLVEECVLLREAREHGLRRARFRRERDALYERGDPEDRERRFEEFHRKWFERMALAQTLLQALDEHPSLSTATRRCIVMPAPAADDEGADLRDERPLAGIGGQRAGPAKPTVILQVRAQTLVDDDALTRLLDHELLHLDDILDPEFGYAPELPDAGSPARARHVAARYRVLWDCAIDGRLHRAGRVGNAIAARRRAEFRAAFPELGQAADREFLRLFEGARPSHGDLLALACSEEDRSLSGICPLCRFPSPVLLDGRKLSGPALTEASSDFPNWRPELGACRQCLDLYSLSHDAGLARR